MSRETQPARLLYTPIMRGPIRWLHTATVVLWFASLLYFWVWWIAPEHSSAPLPFALVSLTLAWLTFTPAYFLLIFSGGRRPSGVEGTRPSLRVAMVVTKAPSEPLSVVAETLEAMLAQAPSHDTWLADEDPSEETLAWAAAHGVKVSTRHGRDNYHRRTWPRRTRCKEGNLAFFYDTYGYDAYDVVVQMDADHVPAPGYLAAMLLPFADPEVGYVSAPSICDRNASQSWSARGRLYAEASMHGSLQAGYNNGWAPLCIGSHYAVRTSALKEIGGLGPELAEDHSTTLMMQSAGWKGVHAIDAIAYGFGPATFTDLIVQEYQWSRSLTSVLLRHTPVLIGGLSPKLRFQFLFAQIWYPFFALFMALGVLMPLVALSFDFSYANISYIEFLLHYLPVSAFLIALAFCWRASGSFRPYDAPIFSWEAALFIVVRWPWALLGSLAAVLDRLTNSYVDFRVTPKGEIRSDDLPARVVLPYAAISIVSGAVALYATGLASANGFYFFAILNAVLYALAVAVILVAHRIENKVRWFHKARRLLLPAAAAGLIAFPGFALGANGLHGLEALTWGSRYLKLTEATFSVAGAGMGKTGVRVLRFKFQWLGGAGQ
ncbi:MAG: glycosyltransferase [Hyphomicrobiales bacterium]|nr:MAG: glycosyltransferase [Hyphomicrobiales bacterium]